MLPQEKLFFLLLDSVLKRLSVRKCRSLLFVLIVGIGPILEEKDIVEIGTGGSGSLVKYGKKGIMEFFKDK